MRPVRSQWWRKGRYCAGPCMECARTERQWRDGVLVVSALAVAGFVTAISLLAAELMR